jgi:tetratricopeptide (TPR) repeat protein
VNRGDDRETRIAPYTGRFAEVMQHLAAGRVEQARALAESWSAEAPGDVPALLALGEAWEAIGNKTGAARAYGSLIDLFPSRADLRRLAGERLERLGAAGLDLAIDTYRKAVLDRPDHPAGHRLLAWALLRAGHPREAFEALEKAFDQRYPGGRFAGVDRVLREDLGLLAAAWLRAEPGQRGAAFERLAAHGARLESEPSLRFVLTWETDANDVDLHVYDRLGGHAFYEQKTLPSGGELFADVTTGYGPECFAVRDPGRRDAAPYRLKVHYYSRGPMGYGMGTVQVIAYDGHGGLRLEPRPFVVMVDHAMVDLGSVDGPQDVRAGK